MKLSAKGRAVVTNHHKDVVRDVESGKGKQDSASSTTTASGESFHGRLAAYCATAGAAGVGMLALAPCVAHAGIIYTPAHVEITPYEQIDLDLNHDGINDFKLIDRGVSGFQYPYLGVKAVNASDRVMGTLRVSRLTKSAVIGPGAPWLLKGTMVNGYFGGPWEPPRGASSVSGYLGFHFDIDGQVHYGWAAVTVSFGVEGFNEELNGYAYDTVANQAIRAGQTSATPEPGTLALLALGSLGLAYWRRTKP
jgi:hypothetical protein